MCTPTERGAAAAERGDLIRGMQYSIANPALCYFGRHVRDMTVVRLQAWPANYKRRLEPLRYLDVGGGAAAGIGADRHAYTSPARHANLFTTNATS